MGDRLTDPFRQLRRIGARHRLILGLGILASSFALSFAGYSLADTTFNDNDNCGSNTLGTNSAETFHMQGGSDCADMNDGDDNLFGGEGSDNNTWSGTNGLDGGPNGDLVEGNGGADVIRGGMGNDLTYGDDYGDDVEDFNGADSLHGGDGSDIVNAHDGAGDDDLNAGQTLGDQDYCSKDNGDTTDGCDHFF